MFPQFSNSKSLGSCPTKLKLKRYFINIIAQKSHLVICNISSLIKLVSLLSMHGMFIYLGNSGPSTCQPLAPFSTADSTFHCMSFSTLML